MTNQKLAKPALCWKGKYYIFKDIENTGTLI